MPAIINKRTKGYRITVLLFLLFIICIPATVPAQVSSADAVVTDFLNVYQTTTDKAVQLAGVIPADTYGWRPAEGIRSVRESILHLAGGNYLFGSMLGIPVPEGIDPRSMENSDLNKTEAIAALKESVTYINEGLKNIAADDFETKIDFFGNKITKRQAMFILGDHAAEHLGQLIAYARSNGVTPPWSR